MIMTPEDHEIDLIHGDYFLLSELETDRNIRRALSIFEAHGCDISKITIRKARSAYALVFYKTFLTTRVDLAEEKYNVYMRKRKIQLDPETVSEDGYKAAHYKSTLIALREHHQSAVDLIDEALEG